MSEWANMRVRERAKEWRAYNKMQSKIIRDLWTFIKRILHKLYTHPVYVEKENKGRGQENLRSDFQCYQNLLFLILRDARETFWSFFKSYKEEK